MNGAVTGIDHLLVDSDNLERDRGQWERLGFLMTPRGRHPQWGTGNYCTMFERDYMELIGVVDPDEFAANASRRGARRQGPGLSAIAFATADAFAARDAFVEAGIAADGPKDLSRLLEGEDGTSEPRFDILHLPADSTPAIPMFLCRHRTPELVRLPGWTDQPNGVTRIVSVAVPVTDPLATVSAHERLLGALSVTITDDMVTLRTGTASILLATQKSLNQLYPDLLPEPDEGACPALVTLAVGDLDGTAGVLAANAILMLREPNALAVAAEDACGIAMVFDGSA